MHLRTEGRSYRQLVTVAHGSRAFVFASSAATVAWSAPPYDELYYGELDAAATAAASAAADAPPLDDRWSDLALLPCAAELRPVGCNMLATRVPGTDQSGAANTISALTSPTPFAVVSDGTYLYVFRSVTADPNSLLVDRFVYSEPAGALVHATETRYVRSGDPDVPASDDDTFGTTDLDGNPFVEPAFLLGLAVPIVGTGFAVVQVPGAPDPRWHIFVPTNAGLDTFAIPCTSAAPFDVSQIAGITVPAMASAVAPATWRTPQLPVTAAYTFAYDGVPVALSSPAAVVHFWQEPGRTADGTPVDVMTTGSVLVTCSTGASRTGELLALDFAIGRDGRLAGTPTGARGGGTAPPLAVTVSTHRSWGTALALNGRADVIRLPDATGLADGATIELWFQPHAGGAAEQGLLELRMPSGYGLRLGLDDGRLAWTLGDTITGAMPYAFAPGTPRLAQQVWALVTVRISATALDVFLAGRPVGRVETAAFSPLDTLAIEVGGTGAPSYFRGAIGEIRVWQTALDDAQIAGLIDLDQLGNYADLPLLYRFPLTEGAGTTIENHLPDHPAVGYPGAISGGRWIPAAPPSNGGMRLASNADLLPLRGCVIRDIMALGPASLAPCVDGRIRLAYRLSDDARWGVAHYLPRLQRVQCLISWSTAGSAVLPRLLFTAVTGGNTMNRAAVAIGTQSNGMLTIELAEAAGSAHRLVETWTQIPATVADVVAILGGERPDTTADPGAPRAYDYANRVTRTRGGVAVDPALIAPRQFPRASLLFSPSSLAVVDGVADQPIPNGALLSTVYGAGTDPCWLLEPTPPVVHGAQLSAGPAEGKLALADDVTLEAWVNMTPAAAELSSIFGLATGGLDYAFAIDHSGRLTAAKSSGSVTVAACTANAVVGANRWMHVAAAYRSSWGLALHDGAYVECGKLERGPTDAVTVEAWLRPDTIPAWTAQVVARWPSGARADTGQFRIELTSTGYLQFTVVDDEGNQHRARSTEAVTLGPWVHVAGQYRAAGTQNLLAFTGEQCAPLLAGSGLTSDTTIELWLRPVVNGGSVLISCARANSDHSLFRLALGSDGYLYIRVFDPDHGLSNNLKVSNTVIPFGATLDTARPVHVALTMSQQVDTVTVQTYIDGVAQTAVNPTTAIPTQIAAFGWILAAEIEDSDDFGDDDDGAQNYYDGGIWDLRLWAVLRTEQEIVDNMTRAVSTTSPGLRGLWSLDTAPMSPVTTDDGGDTSSFAVRPRLTNGVTGESTDVHGAGAAYTASKLTGGVAIAVRNQSGALNRTWSQGDYRPLAPSSESPRFGGGGGAGTAGTALYVGDLDEVRIWNTFRMPAQVDYYLRRGIDQPKSHEDLLGYWTFDDDDRTAIVDQCNDEPGKLAGVADPATAADPFWIPTGLTASWSLWVDGVPALQSVPHAPTKVEGGNAWIGTPDGTAAFPGYLAELRVWRTARTAAQIADNAYRRLHGDEAGLVGYWPCDDNPRTSSTVVASDLAAEPVDATQAAPTTTTIVMSGTTAGLTPLPVSDDVLYGVAASNPAIALVDSRLALAGPPSIVELAGGGARVHTALVTPGGTRTAGAATVSGSATWLTDARADPDGTELVYLGQVQTGARIVGFIEGAPPVPSENLSIESPDNPDKYDGTAKVALTTTHGVSYGRVAKTNVGASLDGLFGVGQKSTAAVGIVFGPVLLMGRAVLTRGLGLDIDADASFRWTRTPTLSLETETGASLAAAGAFEQNMYKLDGATTSDQNPTQPARLYRPDNVGLAIVRSLTADLYAIRSTRTGAVAGYVPIVDPDIPPDANLIAFELNPLYTKAGTLDGYIGFDRDVHYTGLQPPARGSYYKVQEAYAQKAKIQRERAELGHEDLIAGPGVANSGIVNTYVWSASSGLASEETSTSASLREALGADLNLAGSLTISSKGEGEVGEGVLMGPQGKAEIGVGLTFSGTYTGSEKEKAGFSLDVDVDGEGVLSKRAVPVANVAVPGWPTTGRPADPTVTQKDALTTALIAAGLVTEIPISYHPLQTVTQYRIFQTAGQWFLEDVGGKYSVVVTGQTATFTPYVEAGQYPINYLDDACPGKVQTYRFMTFYLPPSGSNFMALAGSGTPIIDPGWLADPTNPDAVALRDALTRPNEAWRIYHRTTYVNRVPPELAATGARDETPLAPPLAVPSRLRRPDDISLARNALLVRLLGGDVGPNAAALPAVTEGDVNANIAKLLGALDQYRALMYTPTRADRLALANRLHDYMVAYAAPDQIEPQA